MGIITLLVVLVYASATRAREKARDAKCLSNLRSIGQLVTSFAGSHGDVPAATICAREYPWSAGWDIGWDLRVGRWAGVPGGRGTIWHCPELIASYAGNAQALGIDTRQVSPQIGKLHEVSTSRWHEPARLALAYDMQYNMFDDTCTEGYPHLADPDAGEVSNESWIEWFYWAMEVPDPVIGLDQREFGPHREAYGLLLADGHAVIGVFRGEDPQYVTWSGRRWWTLDLRKEMPDWEVEYPVGGPPWWPPAGPP